MCCVHSSAYIGQCRICYGGRDVDEAVIKMELDHWICGMSLVASCTLRMFHVMMIDTIVTRHICSSANSLLADGNKRDRWMDEAVVIIDVVCPSSCLLILRDLLPSIIQQAVGSSFHVSTLCPRGETTVCVKKMPVRQWSTSDSVHLTLSDEHLSIRSLCYLPFAEVYKTFYWFCVSMIKCCFFLFLKKNIY